MFSTDLVLKNATPADVTFSLRSTNGVRTERIDQTSTATEPRLVIIDHRRAGKASDPTLYRDEHLVQIKLYKKNATTGLIHQGFVNVTIGADVAGIITRAMLDDAFAFLVNATNGLLVVTGNKDKLLRGES
jgi:hypothetical protein